MEARVLKIISFVKTCRQNQQEELKSCRQEMGCAYCEGTMRLEKTVIPMRRYDYMKRVMVVQYRCDSCKKYCTTTETDNYNYRQYVAINRAMNDKG